MDADDTELETLNMDSIDTDTKPTIIAKTIFRFLLGSVCGLIFVGQFLPNSWYSATGISTLQIVVAVLFTATCGTSSAIWGTKALNFVAKISGS